MVGCNNCVRVSAEMAALEKQMEMFRADVQSQLTDSLSIIVSTKTTVDEMKKHLLGNGQPGKCAMESAKIEDLRDWKTASTAQLRLIKWVVGVMLIPAILQSAALIKQFTK